MLMFVDDLLLFSHGDPSSISIMKSYLERFSSLSDLTANPLKSDCFVSCKDTSIREAIYNASGFWRGTLPIRYLGVPLLSTKLSYKDCQPIIDRVRNRICAWHSRAFSFGGRLQLAQSIISTIYVY